MSLNAQICELKVLVCSFQGSKSSVARLPWASKMWVGQFELNYSLPIGQVDKIGASFIPMFSLQSEDQKMELFSDSVFIIGKCWHSITQTIIFFIWLLKNISSPTAFMVSARGQGNLHFHLQTE